MDYFSKSALFPIPDFQLFVNNDTLLTVPVPHSHDFFEIVLVARGYGEHRFDGQTSCGVMQGDVFAIRPGETHCYADGRQMMIFNVLFDPDFLHPEWSQLLQLPNIARMHSSPAYKYHLKIFERQNAERLLHEIINEIALRRPAFRIRARALLLEFLILAGRAEEQAWRSHDYRLEAIHRAIIYMEQHLKDDLSLEDIARHAGLSRNYFRDFFHQETGTSPWNYFLLLRLECVKKLLGETNLPLNEVAQGSGFCDQSYMARIFRKLEGMTPREYRLALRQLPGVDPRPAKRRATRDTCGNHQPPPIDKSE